MMAPLPTVLTSAACVVLMTAGCTTNINVPQPNAATPASSTAESPERLDETFLAQVRVIPDMRGETKQALIEMGRNTCTAFDQGKKDEILRILSEEYSVSAAADFMHAAAATYCPDHLVN